MRAATRALKHYDNWADAMNRIKELETEQDALRETVNKMALPLVENIINVAEEDAEAWALFLESNDDLVQRFRAVIAPKEQAKWST